MKKLFIAFLAATTLGLAACGEKPTPQPQPQPEPAERCTEHEDGYTGWFLTGPDSILVNGVKASQNKGKEWDFGGDSFELKPTTLAKVKELDAAVGTKLEAKGEDCTGIFSIENVTMGVEKLGWSQNFKGEDGKIYKANASYVAKTIKTKYSLEDDAWSTQTWTPDPKVAHVENLKNYWTPTFQEEADEYGFAWNQNPVVTSGAGVYTVVFATYKGTASLESCNYGCAFIKTEELPVKYEELLPWVANDHTYELIGGFNGWADTGTAAFAKNDEGVFTATVDIPADQLEFKVRADGKWANSWGYTALDNDSKDLVDEADNIKVKEAGRYVVKLSFGIFDFDVKVNLTKLVPNV